jgi:hypothetical protein
MDARLIPMTLKTTMTRSNERKIGQEAIDCQVTNPFFRSIYDSSYAVAEEAIRAKNKNLDELLSCKSVE